MLNQDSASSRAPDKSLKMETGTVFLGGMITNAGACLLLMPTDAFISSKDTYWNRGR